MKQKFVLLLFFLATILDNRSVLAQFVPGGLVKTNRITAALRITSESPDSAGSIELDVRNGNPPYSITWWDSADTPVRTNLKSGIYPVKIQDSLAGSITLSVPLSYDAGWNEMSGLVVSGNTFAKVSPNGWDNSGVNAGVYSDSSGSLIWWVSVDRLTTLQAIGLREASSLQQPGYTDMKYAFYVDGTTVRIFEKGALSSPLTTLTKEDTLKIERTGSLLTFKKNSMSLKSISIPQEEKLKPDFNLFSQGAVISSKYLWFSIKPVEVHATVTDNRCDDVSPNAGSIALNVTGYFGPFSCQWYDVNNLTPFANTTNIGGLPPGSYTARIFYGTLLQATRTFEVGYAALWTDHSGTHSNQNSLVKDSNASFGWNAGGITSNVLPAGSNGWVEFTINSSYDFFTIGLTETNPDNNYLSFSHAIQLSGKVPFVVKNNRVYIYESGQQKYLSPSWYNGFNAGDVFRIERNGAQIIYKKNGQVFFSSACNPAKILFVDASIYTPGTAIKNVRTSFGCEGYPVYGIPAKKTDAGYYMARNGMLHFRFDGEYADGILHYKIFDSKRIEQKGSPPVTLMQKYGDNRMDIGLFPLLANKSGYYTLEIINEKNEKYLLRFRY